MVDILTFPGTKHKKLTADSINFDLLRSSSSGISTTSPPPEKVINTGITRVDNIKSVILNAGNSAGFNAVSKFSAVVTNSMTNWNKSMSDLPASELSTYKSPDVGKVSAQSPGSNAKDKMSFMIDEEEMFIASNLSSSDSEYFVVL